jgi:plasmid maintenance system antidote protein VapI
MENETEKEIKNTIDWEKVAKLVINQRNIATQQALNFELDLVLEKEKYQNLQMENDLLKVKLLKYEEKE